MKKLLIIAGVIIVVIAAVFIYLKKTKLSDFNPAIKEKIQSLIRNASDSLYKIDFDTLIADVTKGTATFQHIHFYPDSLQWAKQKQSGIAPQDVFDVTLKDLSIDGIDVSDITSNKKIDLNILYFNEPSVIIYHEKRNDVKKDTASLQTLYQRISKQMNKIEIKKLLLTNMHVEYRKTKKDSVDKITRFDKVNMVFDDLLIDSLSQFDSLRFMYAKDAQISLTKMQFRTADSLYIIKLDSLNLNAGQKKLIISGIHLNPRGDRETFRSKLAFIKERYDGEWKTFVVKNIDWWSMIASESIKAKEMELSDGKLSVYTDRTLPPNTKSKVGNYPHELIMKVPLPIYIPSFKIKNVDVVYEELNPKTGKQGKLFFSNINGTISNITNDKAIIAHNNSMQINASCIFMKSAHLNATFNFNLSKVKEGVFSVDADLANIDFHELNTVTEPLGLFTIAKGNLKELKAHVDGTDYKGTGDITFLYDGLQINALKKEDGDTTLKKMELISFVANNFVLKKSNPENGKTRIEDAVYNRDIHKSFFNLIWKTMLIGIMKTVGYDKGVKKVK